jgi:hypothetical protein
MRCRDFVAGLLLAGAGRCAAPLADVSNNMLGCNQATTEISPPH